MIQETACCPVMLTSVCIRPPLELIGDGDGLEVGESKQVSSDLTGQATQHEKPFIAYALPQASSKRKGSLAS